VRAGRYTVSATASGYQQKSITVTVEPGKSQAAELVLAREATVAPPPPPKPVETLTKDHFLDPASWTLTDDWWVHKGGSMSQLRRNQGLYVIEFLRQTSKKLIIKQTRHVEWVVDQQADGSRIEYSFDFSNLERKVFVNGKSQNNNNKVKVPPGTGDRYTLQIDISPEQIVIRDAAGAPLDKYERPNPSETLGKFGFKGDVALVIRKAP